MQTFPIAFNLILLQRCVVFVHVLFARFFTYMSPLACGCPKALLSLNLHLPHSSIPRFVDVLSYLNMFHVKIFVLMPFLFPQCLLFWVNKLSGSRSEPMWEFNFKFVKLVCSLHCHKSRICDLIVLILSTFLFQPTKGKNGCGLSLQLPKQYKDVHTNPDSDCYLLRITTLNFIFTSVVMGMTLTLVSDERIHFT